MSGLSSTQETPLIAETLATLVAGTLPRFNHSDTEGWLMPKARARRLCPPARRTAFWIGVSVGMAEA